MGNERIWYIPKKYEGTLEERILAYLNDNNGAGELDIAYDLDKKVSEVEDVLEKLKKEGKLVSKPIVFDFKK